MYYLCISYSTNITMVSPRSTKLILSDLVACLNATSMDSILMICPVYYEISKSIHVQQYCFINRRGN